MSQKYLFQGTKYLVGIFDVHTPLPACTLRLVFERCALAEGLRIKSSEYTSSDDYGQPVLGIGPEQDISFKDMQSVITRFSRATGANVFVTLKINLLGEEFLTMENRTVQMKNQAILKANF